MPVGLGGDGGGSLRIPAACCGLFGLKPTRGRISGFPMYGEVTGLATAGTLARSVRDAARSAGMTQADAEHVVAATAEGYAFPSNLDRDTPVDGMTPRSQADVVRGALDAALDPEALGARLDAVAHAKLSH